MDCITSRTNLKQEDPGYAPLTLEEFRQLPLARRLRERFYRSSTSAGLWLFYLIEIWWNYLIFPNQEHRPSNSREFLIDRSLVTAYAAVQFLGIYLIASMTGRNSPLLFATYASVVPFLVFCALMGFVTFQHHTHPEIPWFDRIDEWSYFQSQVKGTTHICFPPIFDLVLLNILEHSAHHVDPLIPLYQLPTSQDALERAYPDTIKNIPWTPLVLRKTLVCCKLYDYRAQQWLDFRGNPTTPQASFIKNGISIVAIGSPQMLKELVALDPVANSI